VRCGLRFRAFGAIAIRLSSPLVVLLLAACRGTDVASGSSPPPVDPTPGGVTVEKVAWKGESESADDPAAPHEEPASGNKPKRWNGVVAHTEDPATAEVGSRCLIRHALVGSPADDAGLRRGDRIVRSAGVPVTVCKDYLQGARTVAVGGILPLDIERDGTPLTVSLAMAEMPGDAVAFRKEAWPGHAFFAYDVETVRPPGGRVRSDAPGTRLRLLYFWATWCGPCRQTGPRIDAAWKEFGTRGLQVLAVTGEEKEPVDRYLVSSDTTYPIAIDTARTVKEDYEIKKLPTVVLIDGEGRVVLWDYGVPGVERALSEVRRRLAG
jgi:thiol-disulfide isomerase/thioredoxin